MRGAAHGVGDSADTTGLGDNTKKYDGALTCRVREEGGGLHVPTSIPVRAGVPGELLADITQIASTAQSCSHR